MFKKLLALFILSLAAFSSIHLLLPENNFNKNPTPQQFSNARAMQHVQQLAKKPHAVGPQAHDLAMQYCIDELKKMGLEVQTQQGNSSSSWGTFAKVKNVIARIKGSENNKALLLMSHYDSAGNTSFGASDAASGVAVILEGIRSFIAQNTNLKNDVIILLTDGEELGLNGANLFVKQHPWIKDVGLVLNFEARGSGGPSFTLLETNKGNSRLVAEFTKANPKFPVANSLAYSIYKKLPNDTDLTVFRKEGNIPGFNFAFIDDHYDYHSALDIPERLDNKTLSHQASYLMPLLQYFSNTNLSNFNSNENWVYFNSPIGMSSYPYSYILPLVIIAFILFTFVFYYGKKQQKLDNKEIGKGFIAFISILIINGIIGFFGWKLILKAYPQYQEILQGFPYNGHTYILFFILLALAINFYGYKKVFAKTNTKELLVAPIVIWLLINVIISQILPGASFFIIPLFFTIALWFFSIRTENPSLIANTLLCLPAIFIFVPFIQQFPIALGLKVVVSSTVLTTLLFGLLLPVFGPFRRKRTISRMLFISAIVTFIIAHTKSDFSPESPKPNSLVFLQDDTTKQSYWMSYDNILDEWNQPYFSSEINAEAPKLNSKYETPFKHISKATPIHLAATPMSISFDTIINTQRNIRFCVDPKRHINSIIIQSKQKNDFSHFTINGDTIPYQKKSKFNKKGNDHITQYFMVDQEALEIDLSFPKDQKPTLQLIEVSYNLLSHPKLNVNNRNANMMPKPFVITDAILVKQKIDFNAKN